MGSRRTAYGRTVPASLQITDGSHPESVRSILSTSDTSLFATRRLSDHHEISAGPDVVDTDNVRISSTPNNWNIRPLVFLGAILGLVMVLEALLILWICIKFEGL